MNTNQDTTLTTYDKFEAWFEENYPLGNKTKNRDKNSAYEGYQAATKASEQHIQELLAKIQQFIALTDDQETKILELTASNNQLREALEVANRLDYVREHPAIASIVGAALSSIPNPIPSSS